MAKPSLKLAFIGTGLMGAPICLRLLSAGYELTVFNRTKEKAAAVVKQGAAWADSAAEAVADADVVFTMLGYPDELEELYLASGGILRATKTGAWMIDLSTSSPELARDLAAAAEIEDKHAFDCPVTGGVAGAQEGSLTLIAGISEKDAAPVADVLSSFSSKIIYFDAPGKGQLAKLCNQVSLASCMVGYADALSLAKLGDLNPNDVRELIMSGTGASGAMEKLAPLSLAGDYKPGFYAEHLRKDLALALNQAADLGVVLPGADTAYSLFETLCAIGGAHLGTQALSVLYEDTATASAVGLDWALLEGVQEEGSTHCDHTHEGGCCHGEGHGNGCCHHHEE